MVNDWHFRGVRPVVANLDGTAKVLLWSVADLAGVDVMGDSCQSRAEGRNVDRMDLRGQLRFYDFTRELDVIRGSPADCGSAHMPYVLRDNLVHRLWLLCCNHVLIRRIGAILEEGLNTVRAC